MPTRERPIDAGTRRATSAVMELGKELRQARVAHGLSQRAVARAAGMCQSKVSMVERGLLLRVSVYDLARLLAVVGLDLSARAYPAGPPIRDIAHRRLLARLVARASPALRWRFEVPLPGPGDRRAWDGVADVGGIGVGVEAETHASDGQALAREVALKRRDDPRVHHVILLLADTRSNRAFLEVCFDALRPDFPLRGADVVRALSEGRDPGGSAVLVL